MQSGVLTYRGNNRDISAIIQKLADMKTISKESRKAIDFLREKEIKPYLEISKYIDIESLYPYNKIINGSETFETTQDFSFYGNYFELDIIANFKYRAYHASETYTDPEEKDLEIKSAEVQVKLLQCSLWNAEYEESEEYTPSENEKKAIEQYFEENITLYP